MEKGRGDELELVAGGTTEGDDCGDGVRLAIYSEPNLKTFIYINIQAPYDSH